MLFEHQQCQARARGVTAFVAPIDACSRPGLFAVVAGDDAVAHGHGVIDGKLIETCRRLPRHDVVVACLTANDATKGDTSARNSSTAPRASSSAMSS